MFGIALGGAAIGVGVYFLVRHDRSITGCAVSSPNGIKLLNEGDQQTYALVGDRAGIKPENPIWVSDKTKGRMLPATGRFSQRSCRRTSVQRGGIAVSNAP
jgi:hypothetical protein